MVSSGMWKNTKIIERQGIIFSSIYMIILAKTQKTKYLIPYMMGIIDGHYNRIATYYPSKTGYKMVVGIGEPRGI